MSPIKSQLLGLALATATAVGCIAYERLVKACSLAMILFLASCFYLPLFAAMLWSNPSSVRTDFSVVWADPKLRLSAAVYFATWITTPLWFVITKKQGVVVGAIYEVKYIVIMALMYLLIGARPMTMNVAVGVALALASIWFISRG